MNTKKSKRWTKPKALLIIPVATLAIGVFANNAAVNNTTTETDIDAITTGQWKFSGDKHKSLQVDTERTFHQRYPLVML